MCVCVCVHAQTGTHHSACVEVQRQLVKVDSLFIPCGFWELNVGYWFGIEYLYLVSHLSSPVVSFLLNPHKQKTIFKSYYIIYIIFWFNTNL